jgi:hypothetical protein
MNDGSGRNRRARSSLLANWTQPGPLGWKLKRTAANFAIKVTRRQTCCGHPGEPGC